MLHCETQNSAGSQCLQWFNLEKCICRSFQCTRAQNSEKQQSKATCWVTEGSSWLPTLPTEEASAPIYKTSKFATRVETKTANHHKVCQYKYFAGQIISSAWNNLQIKSSAFQTELTEVWQLKGLRGGVGLRLCLCSNASTLPLYQLDNIY